MRCSQITTDCDGFALFANAAKAVRCALSSGGVANFIVVISRLTKLILDELAAIRRRGKKVSQFEIAKKFIGKVFDFNCSVLDGFFNSLFHFRRSYLVVFFKRNLPSHFVSDQTNLVIR